MSKEIKGVTSQKPVRKVEEVPYAPENLHISRDEFIKRRNARKAAKQAAEDAYNSAMKSHGVELPEAPVVEEPKVQEKPGKAGDIEAKLSAARKKLMEAEAKLKADPDSAYHNKRVRDLNAEVEKLENQLD